MDCKFLPWTSPSHPRYNPIVNKPWFRAWNHWLNPLGNYHEPLPYPEVRDDDARKSWLHPAVWWALRNPFHNLTHFWIGITPVGPRYAWVSPEEAGWVKRDTVWEKGWIVLPRYSGTIGWQSRGNFRAGKVVWAVAAAAILLTFLW